MLVEQANLEEDEREEGQGQELEEVEKVVSPLEHVSIQQEGLFAATNDRDSIDALTERLQVVESNNSDLQVSATTIYTGLVIGVIALIVCILVIALLFKGIVNARQ